MNSFKNENFCPHLIPESMKVNRKVVEYILSKHIWVKNRKIGLDECSNSGVNGPSWEEIVTNVVFLYPKALGGVLWNVLLEVPLKCTRAIKHPCLKSFL